MELHEFAARSPRPDPLRSNIARLIEVVGTPKFETEMFHAAHAATNCEHVTAFATCKNSAPRILLAANTGTRPIAKSVGEKYLARFWKLDPANHARAFDKRPASYTTLRILPRDIDDSSYRHECYTSTRLQDRFSVMQSRSGEVYRINFYRGVRSGRFAESDFDRIVNSADLFMSLLVKHDAINGPGAKGIGPDLFVNRLRLLEPAMPSRRTEVCAAIMLGMTSEAIALKLGISVNTVLTYRKRAYSRIGISCQNELLRLILS